LALPNDLSHMTRQQINKNNLIPNRTLKILIDNKIVKIKPDQKL
jgi:hypothetical protein